MNASLVWHLFSHKIGTIEHILLKVRAVERVKKYDVAFGSMLHFLPIRIGFTVNRKFVNQKLDN